MYTDEMIVSLHAQRLKRRTLVLLLAAVIAAPAIVCAVLRLQILTMILSFLCGAWLIFSFDCLLRPLKKYERHMTDCLHGRTHEVPVYFRAITDEESLVDGVYFRAVETVEAEGDKPSERLFYWDSRLPWPDYAEGKKLLVTYHDHAIADIREA